MGVAHAAWDGAISMKVRYRAATVRGRLKQSAWPTPPGRPGLGFPLYSWEPSCPLSIGLAEPRGRNSMRFCMAETIGEVF